MPKLSDFDSSEIEKVEETAPTPEAEEPSKAQTPAVSLSELTPSEIQSAPPEEEKDLYKTLREVPYVGKPAAGLLEAREDLQKSFFRNLFGGLGGKGEAGLRAALDLLKGSDKDYSELYKEEKKKVSGEMEKSRSRSPISSMAGSALGAAAPAIATMGLGTGAQIAAGMGAGALEAIGENKGDDYSQLAKSAGEKMLLEGALGVGGTVTGELLGMGAKNMAEALQNSSFAKQLAATIMNAAPEAGEGVKKTSEYVASKPSIFKETGDVIYRQSKQLAENLAEKLIKPIIEKNRQFDDAFDVATKIGKKTSSATNQDLIDIQQLQREFKKARLNFSKELPTWTEENIFKYGRGQLDPNVANQMTGELKNLNISQVEPKLERMRNYVSQNLIKNRNASLDPATFSRLNREKKAALDAVELVTQPGRKQATKEGFQVRDAGDYPPEQLRSFVRDFYQNAIESAGKSTTTGKGREILKEATENIDVHNKIGNLGLNPQEMEQAVRNQAYLSGARQAVTGGILTSEGQTAKGVLQQAVSKAIESPFKIAERVAGSQMARDAAGLLLKGTPENLTNIGRKMQANPNLKHLGKGLEDAVAKNSRQAINAAIFTILQNPLARRTIEEDEGTSGE